MSSFTIENGVGDGKKAEVNAFNQLLTLAEAVPSEGVQGQRGRAFIISARTDLAATASGGLMHILNNDAENDLEITRIYTYGHTLTPTDLIITQVFDPNITNGTDVSSTAIVNKNRGFSTPFDLTVTISDSASDMTYTGGTVFHEYPLTSMSTSSRNMNGTNIIPAGKSMLFGFFTSGGGAATNGENVFFAVNCIKRKIS